MAWFGKKPSKKTSKIKEVEVLVTEAKTPVAPPHKIEEPEFVQVVKEKPKQVFLLITHAQAMVNPTLDEMEKLPEWQAHIASLRNSGQPITTASLQKYTQSLLNKYKKKVTLEQAIVTDSLNGQKMVRATTIINVDTKEVVKTRDELNPDQIDYYLSTYANDIKNFKKIYHNK